MKYGLSDAQLHEIINVLKQYPEIEKAILFGSRALNTFKEASNVDIALIGKKINFMTAAHIKDELEEETYLPFFVDVIAYNSIDNEALKEHIRNFGIMIYESRPKICKNPL